LLLDKPEGYSSSQAVQKVRWLFGAKKAGHTGSLDPFATGMLPICFGEASKTAGFMLDASKSYLATAVLGQATSTGDTEGELVQEMPQPNLAESEIRDVFDQFCGTIEQIPPMYSALKSEGTPLYKLARAGITVERKARTVCIHRLDLQSWDKPVLKFVVRCSKGTYIRTLAEDIASKLGSCAHLIALRRLDVEPFRQGDMVSLEAVEQAVGEKRQDALLLPIDAGLAAWPRVELDEFASKRFRNGNPVPVTDLGEGRVRVFDSHNCPLGLGETGPDGKLNPKRVFVFEH
jgi:tRNA pseudouridine55 synthase